jgi:hypothetical protein
MAENEVLYRFEFPERPGALMKFLNSMSHAWNISLFHYRNHGADYGRVLVGIQVPPEQKAAFQKFLDGLGYQYWNESRNPAYAHDNAQNTIDTTDVGFHFHPPIKLIRQSSSPEWSGEWGQATFGEAANQ